MLFYLEIQDIPFPAVTVSVELRGISAYLLRPVKTALNALEFDCTEKVKLILIGKYTCF